MERARLEINIWEATYETGGKQVKPWQQLLPRWMDKIEEGPEWNPEEQQHLRHRQKKRSFKGDVN